MKGKRIGIFGGTFNPIHFGHLRAAEEVRYKCQLEKILFIPAYIPPHKNSSDIASSKARWDMICLALSNNDAFMPLDIEIKKEKISYSIDTLKELRNTYSDSIIFFIMGIDSFMEIKTWKNYIELIENYFLIVMSRPGFELENAKLAVPSKFSSKIFFIRKEEDFNRTLSAPPQIFLIPIKALNISSTEIRNMIKKGESIKYLLPENVEKYIFENRLYQK
ncbi:nicotinate-nucleotide adenylyltransferase [Candidatus Aminicenantes bacterium AC-708-M15]|jgi:nicotinate-nucleotide adenylyltransferase|nr:nicotinate-nucleotide adenylyltransferase [SCandidatus Aminicenantes bacterium Aminicenantia_JdfR_composite]MCP2596817.1 nicotinate-nucleotide adenylyltransferase [Candidatus Aminicenantes bacterium AC-335-G13]MCP2598278.1 nicotinate-nucleotide adenylyltransferase [Candidatus Aminicenantes bacterium AC-335-L06]MCP2604017.1 nicotinate-nucleotide adenylyltransferase [Candidatus Aminicenantes bacterium AC-708-M15]MCP2606496.1 nicotinate-nucleotide adenylyltransferase [Candidatus Aminicenantes b